MTNTSHTTDTATHQIVFIDSRVPDLQSIIAAAQPGVKVVVLSASESGVSQMAKALEGEHGLTSISVVSHGDKGVLLLGNGPLFTGNIEQHQTELQAIGAALGPDGDLQLYGCDVGAGEVGAQFMQALSDATGADVAASNDSTGGSGKAGDWDLEVSTGQVEAPVALNVQALAGYEYSLHTASVSTVAQLKAAITTGNTDGSNDVITLTGNITFASAADTIAINVTDGKTMSIVGGGFTLSGNNVAQVLNTTTSGAGSEISIDNLTITNGFVTGAGGDRAAGAGGAGGDSLGAGISNAGTLTITNSTITGNKAAGGGGAGGNLFNGSGAGAGGGGGGYGTTFGGASGNNFGGNIQAGPSAGIGGHGGGYVKGGDFLGGRGGSTVGGLGANYGGYSFGGTGGSANAGGTLKIGGGGGGAGYDAAGGRGGNAVGGVFNSGTITFLTTSITNNIGAGGGGGGGSTAGHGTANGGAGGNGVGGIWSTGTLQMDAASSSSLATNNKGGGGAGGIAGGGSDGVVGATANTNLGTITPIPPTITSAAYDASAGTLMVTGASMTTGDTIDVTKLSLTGQGGTYALTSTNVTATSATAFSVTLNAADKLAVNGVLNNNGTASVGATTFNLAGAANWDTTASAPADLTGNAVTVSNVTAPTITSATYDGTTHVFTVTGTGLVKTLGATNDVTVSTLTITGEGGATRTLSTTGNVEVTSATSFTFTLAGADIAAVDSLLNKNGTSSAGATTYNLAAADDWNSVVTGGNIADATNAITVSNAAPSILSSTYDAATGILSVSALNIVGGDTIDVTKLSLTGQAGSYTLTTANVTASSSTAFSVTLNAADKLAINGILNTNGTTAVDTTTFNLAAAANWDATTTSSADLTGNGVTVSNVAAPTITSATYDGTTHVFTVTGTGLVKTIGATNDVTINKLTIIGEGGATRTLSTTGNVEVTSATSFTFTVAGADIAAVDALLNKNGTSSAGATAYNLAAADDWNSVITGGSIADLTGNSITVSNAAPSIASATYDAATGILTVSALNIVGGDTIDVSKLSLTGQGGSYTLTTANVTASSATAFSVTLNAADKLAINGILNKTGTSAVDTTTFNLAAAANWDQTTTSSADLTGNAVTVSNVAAPTITSATYDGTTHVFTVTGTNLVKTIGATNDVTVSTLTITGEGGATRTLSTTGNVEVTSATSFTFTLAGADIAAVDSLLNKNGTSSAGATTYNLAAADDWNSVVTGGNIADATNAITVSNAAPSILSSTYDAATGILSVSALNIVGGDTIDVTKLSLTGQAGSYTLTTANVTASSSTAFSVTLNAADKLAINGILNTNGTTAVDTTTFNLAAAANWDATTTSSADLTGNGVTVSNVAAPTITSATYDGTTHVFTVTGTGLVKTIGATNDVTINKLTIIGEGGATRTLSTTGNVEVTSATSFTFTVAGADIAAVDALLNKNGTSSAGATAYNLAAADDWNSVITGGSIADLTGNSITVSNAAPSIASATYDAATGILTVSALNIVGGDTIDVSKLSLTGQTGSYTLTTANVTASSSTAFAVTLNAADKLAINGILNTNGTSAVDTTVFNLAAAASWDATTTSSADLTGNSVIVSNVAAPTVTSATYDGTTNTLVVTGTGLVKTIGAPNDVTVNKLTITGEGGATYTLSTSGNVEVTSATSFTVTLAGADIAGVASLLNKNGTSSASSATTYNIAAADDWNSVITGGNIADLTGNGITVANAAPSILSSAYDAATGILSVSAVNIVGGDTIDVSKLSVVGQGGGSYTLTSGNVAAASATAFSVTLNAADKLAVGGLLNKAGTTAADATTFNLAAAASWDATTTSGADLTGNAVTVSNVSAPTITSATYDVTTHILTVTGTNLVQTLGATNDVTVAALTITGEGGVARTLSTTGNVEVLSATSFAVTLAGADVAAVEALFNKNGTTSTSGTTYNLAAADDWNSVVTGGDIADLTGNAITVSNVPVPTITSATYNVATGALVVTGTGLGSKAGPANDIVASKFTLTGEGNATYTLTTTANVDITSATSFTLILSPVDQAAVRAIANKNGTSSTSGTTYNLAAAEDWAAGADAAVVLADLTGNGITVASVAVPTVTSATYNVGTGVLVVTGTGLLGRAGAANDIVANKLTFTGQAGGTYTLTDTPDADIASSTSFTLTLSATDKTAVNLLLNKEGTASNGGTTYNIALAEDWNAGADAAVVIADLTGNAVTASGFPSDGGGTPPAGTPIDGVPVITEPGPGGSTIITIPVVLPTRPDTPGTPSPLADIPLVTSPSGTPIVSVSVPTGVGLQAEGLTTTTMGSAALAELGFRIERVTGNNPELTNAGQVFYATLNPNEPLSVQILKPTIGAGYDGTQPLVINGSNNPADGKQAVILDARSLPSGTVIQVDNIEFIAVVGNVRLIGGAGQNAASGDSGAQWIVLGPDDDIIHGGGGNDVVGSEAGDDQVFGDAGDDIVFGGAGNDLLSGGTGSDRLNGGTGFDVAIQEGTRADYTVTLEGAGIKLTHTASGVSDWLVDVEQVRFATGPSLTVAHSAAEEAGAYLFQKWLGRDLNQGEGAIIQSLTGKTALEVATLFAQVFPEQSAGKTPAQLLEGMGAAGAVRVDAVRDITVTGDAGNNTISPTLGLARYVDGGAGIDTVVIPATLSQTYVQSQNNGSFTLQRLTDGAMLDVTRVERVTFNDTRLALDLNGHAGEAAKLLGALGGPALLTNKGVVGEVIRLLDAGASSQTIAGLGLQLLGASTPTQIAQTLWTNVVGRAGTDSELKLLTDIMAGGVSASELTVMAANLELNAVRIDLVGLAAKGIEFA
ncbi:DUF4347 domain-containing protein [Acidovorax sp. LjRoot118]|uniref:DUF4347 domain-containing protein n=1 Tax=Acidovorax sp. LjRoot118 TaxID=3342256 RepID=UPI003ECF892A